MDRGLQISAIGEIWGPVADPPLTGISSVPASEGVALVQIGCHGGRGLFSKSLGVVDQLRYEVIMRVLTDFFLGVFSCILFPCWSLEMGPPGVCDWLECPRLPRQLSRPHLFPSLPTLGPGTLTFCTRSASVATTALSEFRESWCEDYEVLGE
jgi:hypothetical protein